MDDFLDYYLYFKWHCFILFCLSVRVDLQSHASAGHIFSTSKKPSTKKDAWTLFCGIPTYDKKAIEFQIFYELKN